MIGRIARLVRAELLKLGANPFFYVSLALIFAFVAAAEKALPALKGLRVTEWRGHNAVLLFSFGFDWGLRVATYVLLIFSSMSFAGEFDRGTIKVLLTRPVTRGEFFAAKGTVVLLLGLFLFAYVLYWSLFFGFLWGDLGPVWDDASFVMQRDGEEIAAFARKAVAVTLLSFLAAGFLGMLVSNWTESSGYAVAIAIVLFFAGDLFSGGLKDDARMRTFFFYPAYALGKLQEYAQGGTSHWREEIERSRLFLTVPLAYVAVFLPAAFGIFRARDIRA
jgi:ABC-type transport system involved in multi-copper enzyme maturation permease subunit